LLHVWVYSFDSQGRFGVGWKGLTEWAKPKNESAAGGGGNVFPIFFYLLTVFRPIPISLGSFISLVFFYVPFYFIVVGGVRGHYPFSVLFCSQFLPTIPLYITAMNPSQVSSVGIHCAIDFGCEENPKEWREWKEGG
jgi:hypothetical protein